MFWANFAEFYIKRDGKAVSLTSFFDFAGPCHASGIDLFRTAFLYKPHRSVKRSSCGDKVVYYNHALALDCFCSFSAKLQRAVNILCPTVFVKLLLLYASATNKKGFKLPLKYSADITRQSQPLVEPKFSNGASASRYVGIDTFIGKH